MSLSAIAIYYTIISIYPHGIDNDTNFIRCKSFFHCSSLHNNFNFNFWLAGGNYIQLSIVTLTMWFFAHSFCVNLVSFRLFFVIAHSSHIARLWFRTKKCFNKISIRQQINKPNAVSPQQAGSAIPLDKRVLQPKQQIKTQGKCLCLPVTKLESDSTLTIWFSYICTKLTVRWTESVVCLKITSTERDVTWE